MLTYFLVLSSFLHHSIWEPKLHFCQHLAFKHIFYSVSPTLDIIFPNFHKCHTWTQTTGTERKPWQHCLFHNSIHEQKYRNNPSHYSAAGGRGTRPVLRWWVGTPAGWSCSVVGTVSYCSSAIVYMTTRGVNKQRRGRHSWFFPCICAVVVVLW